MFTQHDVAKFMIEQGAINKSLADTTKSLAEDMKDIKISMQNQEVLLEKLSNVESKIDDNNKRVHKRIDLIEKDYKDRIKEIETETKEKVNKLEKHNEREIEEVKKEHIEPINQNLTWLWRTVFAKLILFIIALLGIIYDTLTGG